MVVNIVEELQKTGLTEYEARAFFALYGVGKALTAYEIAKTAGIPTSKIYEVISRLTEREMAYIVEESGKKKYLAKNPDEYLDSYRKAVEESLSKLKTELGKVNKAAEESAVWNFHDYDDLVARSERMIRGARERILLSVWKEEALPLEAALEEAAARGVKISIVHFGPPQMRIGQIFRHPIEDTLYAEKGGRGFVLVADETEAVAGTVYGDRWMEGAWSTNRGFVTLAEDYIKHDVYIMKIVNRFNGLLVERFGENYVLLRDVFTDGERGKE